MKKLLIMLLLLWQGVAWGEEELAKNIQLTINYDDTVDNYFANLSSCDIWRQPVSIFVEKPLDITSEEWNYINSAIINWQKYFPLSNVSELKNATIVVRWVDEFNDPEKPLGRAMTPNHARNGLPIYLDMLHPKKYGKIPTKVVKTVLMHETGHALGICSHSDRDGDLMSPKVHSMEKGWKKKHLLTTALLNAVGLPFGVISVPSPTILLPSVVNSEPTQRDLNSLYLLYKQENTLTFHMDINNVNIKEDSNP